MTQLYLKITDTNTILWTNAQGLQAKAPIFPFKVYDEIELQFLNEDNLPYTNFNDATTFKVSGDVNFVWPEPDDVMFKTVDADIDKTDISQGILRFPVDTNTTNFRDVIEGTREKTIYFEIEGTGLIEATPRVVWRKSVIVTAQAAISIDGTVPEGVITDYYTKTEVSTLLNSKVETDLSGYPADLLDGTETIYIDDAGTPKKTTAQDVADLTDLSALVVSDLSGYPTDTLDGSETMYVDAAGTPSKVTAQDVADLAPSPAGKIDEDLSGYPTDTLDGTETVYVDAAGTPSKVTAQDIADLAPPAAGGVTEDLSGYPTDTLDGTETVYVDAAGTPSKVTAQDVADLGTGEANAAQASAGEITAGTEVATRDHSPADIVSYITQHETGEANAAQASAGEITAGTEVATRDHSPADIVSYITQHETGGTGKIDEDLSGYPTDTLDGTETVYVDAGGTPSKVTAQNIANLAPASAGAVDEDLSGYPTDTLDGTETVYVDAAGTPSKVTAQAIADLGGGAGGGLEWNAIAVNTPAVDSNGYMADTTGNTIDITLPITPTIGDRVGVKAIDLTNTLTVLRNGSNIEGSATDLVVDIAGSGFELVYHGATYGWVVVTEINGGGPGVTEDLSGYPTDTLDGTETMYVDAGGTPSKVTAQDVADLAPSPAGKIDEDLSGYPTDTLDGTETVYVDAAGTPSKVTAQAIADLGGGGGGGGFADEGTRVVKTADYTILDAELTGKTFQLGSATTADREFTLPTTVGTDEAADGVYIENASDFNLRIIMANGSDVINHLKTDMYLQKGDGRVLFRPYATDNNWGAE